MPVVNNSYSWHSFQNNGAHQSAIKGISDSDIKMNFCWLRYTHIMYIDANLNNSICQDAVCYFNFFRHFLFLYFLIKSSINNLEQNEMKPSKNGK